LIPALRSSVIVTPSLLRKWRIEDESIIRADKPQVLYLPLRLTAKELEPFIAFVTKRLRAREVKIKEEPSKGGVIRKISFVTWLILSSSGSYPQDRFTCEECTSRMECDDV